MTEQLEKLPKKLTRGCTIIAQYVKTLPHEAGVYRMLSHDRQVLYVGKAKSLKKRVNSYTQVDKLPTRLKRMVSETASMEFITTKTEAEALLLEANLIKRLLPRYNILFRDDKAYAQIGIQKKHPFPEVTKTRSKDNNTWELYGPFASASAIDNTLTALQKAFLLRSCSDSFFNARKRPCLQYYIKRCSAPCVGYIDASRYQHSLQSARDVLTGKSQKIQEMLSIKMQAASEQKDYELAAFYRDQIQALATIQAEQSIYMPNLKDADIFAIVQQDGRCCIQVIFYRNHSHYGNQAIFPKHDREASVEEILASVIPLFYQSVTPPPEIFTNITLKQQALIQQALSEKAGYRVKISVPKRGKKKDVLDHAEQNALGSLSRKLAESATIKSLHKGVAKAFALAKPPARIEVYDNSHIQGSNPVGAMIVAGNDGFEKSAYRLFTIKSAISPGDDYGMMREVISRRFANLTQEGFIQPDLMLIDGGQGQLNVVLEILDELKITGTAVIAIAKGKARIAGEERFFKRDLGEFRLQKNDPVFYYIQRLRDEAHRFAITSHRKKRVKNLKKSAIDDIPGIGSKRKRLLLRHFGSAKSITEAGVSDLEKVEGISKTLARTIYDFFHNTSGGQ